MRCSFFSGLQEFLQEIVLVFVNLVESSTLKYKEAKILFQHLSNIDLNNELDMILRIGSAHNIGGLHDLEIGQISHVSISLNVNSISDSFRNIVN